LQEAQANRVQLLSDLFTVVAAYEASGETAQGQVLVGYEQWSRWVQQPLVWLGVLDPVESVRRLQAEDPDRDLLDQVADLWDDVYGTRWVVVKGLAEFDRSFTPAQAAAQVALQKVLGDECGRDREGNLDRKKVGHWLKKMKGRWTPGGLRLEQESRGADKKTNRSARWRVVAVEGSEGSGGFFPTPGISNEGVDRDRGEGEKPSETPQTLHVPDDGDDF
jgi:hypothetical protein